MTEPEPRRSRAYLILKLARPHFLIPGFLLYLFGFLFGALRGGIANAGVFIFGYSIFWAAQLSVHFSNDYFDREGDRLGKSSALSGGSGVLVEHGELERFALRAALMLLLGSVALAGIFTWAYSFPISFFFFSVAGALIGWFYSAPPLRFSSNGLSELTTSFASGFMMPGMGYFVSFGRIDPWFILLSLPMMCFTFFFILTVEMPDVEADLLAKKRNLLTNHGRRFGVLASLLFTAMGVLSLLAIAASGAMGDKTLFLWLSIFAIFPFLGAASGLFNRLSTPREVYRQTKINFASLMIFLLSANAYLLVLWIRV